MENSNPRRYSTTCKNSFKKTIKSFNKDDVPNYAITTAESKPLVVVFFFHDGGN